MFDFYWKVPQAGFEWLKSKTHPLAGAEPEEGEFLVERNLPDRSPRYRSYAPTAEAALFKSFADVAATRAGILAFASKYGFLGSDAEVPVQQPVPEKENTFYTVRGERFEVWQREIEDMRHAVDLWEAACSGNSEYLSKFIKWHGPEAGWQAGGFSYIRPGGRDSRRKQIPLASLQSSPELMSLFTVGDLILPARHALHYLVNEKIEQHGAAPRLMWDRTHGRMRETVCIVPQNLISWLWIQLANAIEGDRQYRRCDECREWFEVSGDRRADARFCSNRCRFKAYRERQSEARRLSAAGVPAKEIAKRLGSDMKTVKGWIS